MAQEVIDACKAQYPIGLSDALSAVPEILVLDAVNRAGKSFVVGARLKANEVDRQPDGIFLCRGGVSPEVIALTVFRALDLGETDTSEAREIEADLRVLSDLRGMHSAVKGRIGR